MADLPLLDQGGTGAEDGAMEVHGRGKGEF